MDVYMNPDCPISTKILLVKYASKVLLSGQIEEWSSSVSGYGTLLLNMLNHENRKAELGGNGLLCLNLPKNEV